MSNKPLLAVENYSQSFVMGRHLTIDALKAVSLQIQRGEILGLVGESGCGKSTLARAIMGIYKPSSGAISFKGNVISTRAGYAQHKTDIQRNIQPIFQDSAAALNPRMTVAELIAEPFVIHHSYQDKHAQAAKVDELLFSVGLGVQHKSLYPAEISGGQRQRVSIARSIALDPELIIADEPVASLDVSIQAQIITLFQRLQREKQFSFLFIAHDLSMVRYISNRIAVMYGGRIVEIAPTETLFSAPRHPYTQALLSAIPVPDPHHERQKRVLTFDAHSLNEQGELTEVAPRHWVYG